MQLIRPGLPSSTSVTIDETLYGADVDELLDRVRRLPSTAAGVLLIGHNPGIGDLAVMLAGQGDRAARASIAAKFPTAALAILAIDGEWTAVARRSKPRGVLDTTLSRINSDGTKPAFQVARLSTTGGMMRYRNWVSTRMAALAVGRGQRSRRQRRRPSWRSPARSGFWALSACCRGHPAHDAARRPVTLPLEFARGTRWRASCGVSLCPRWARSVAVSLGWRRCTPHFRWVGRRLLCP